MNKTLSATAVFLIFFSSIFSGFSFKDLNLEAIAPKANGIEMYQVPLVNSVNEGDTIVSHVGHANNVPGNTVHINDESGTEIGNDVIQTDTTFSVKIPAQSAGDNLFVYQTDADGNFSPEGLIIVHVSRTIPKVDPIPNGATMVYGQPGSAYPGAIVFVLEYPFPSPGSIPYKTIANDDGSYAVDISGGGLPTGSGTQLSVRQASPTYASDLSPSAVVTISQEVIPPKVQPVKDGDVMATGVEGDALPNNNILLYNEKMVLVGNGQADSKGAYGVVRTPSYGGFNFVEGEKYFMQQKDSNGNVSSFTPFVVGPKDVVDPAPLINDVYDGDIIATADANSAVAGNTILLYDQNNDIVGRTIVNDNGSYVVSKIPNANGASKFVTGETYYVSQVTPIGIESEKTQFVVKGEPLPAPKINDVYDGDIIATADANSAVAGNTILLYDQNNDIVGRTIVNDNGSYVVSKIPNANGASKFVTGETYYVSQTSPIGIESEKTQFVVKGAPLPAPKINEVYEGDTVVTGDEGAAIYGQEILVELKGVVIGREFVNENGSYSVTVPTQVVGDELVVTQVDVSGSKSLEAKTTVLKLFYNVEFNLNGDTTNTVDTQVVKKGEYVSEPDQLIREGYSFIEWNTSPDGTGNRWVFDVDVMPADDLVLYAIWEVNPLTVNPMEPGDTCITGTGNEGNIVEIKDEDGNVIGTAVISPDGTFEICDIVPGGDGTINQIDPDGNSSVPIILRTVTFDANGGTGTTLSPLFIEDGKTVSQPENPVKHGFKFVGWTENNNTYDFASPVTATITLVASWEEIPLTVDPMVPGTSCLTGSGTPGNTVEIKDENGQVIGTAVIGPDGTYEICDLVPGGDGSINQIDPDGNSSAPIILHTVTFDANGGTGTTLSPLFVEDGKTVSQPVNPVKDGFKFVGWTKNNNTYDFASPVTATITLVASWEEIPLTVDPMVPGTSCLTGSGTPGNTVEIKDENGQVIGTAVIGPDGTYEICDLVPGGDGSINQIDPDGNSSVPIILHTVTFDVNGGTGTTLSPLFVEDGKTVSQPVNPVKDGFKFVGWTKNNNTYDFASPVTATITLVASWEEIPFTVDPMVPGTSCLTGSGTPGNTVEIKDENGQVIGTAVISPDGTYEICDLVPGGDATINQVNPDGNTITTIVLHTITFDSNGGSKMTPNSVFVEEGKVVLEPADPTKSNYLFDGWYDNNDYIWDFSMPVSESLILTAKWSLVSPTVDPINPGDTCITGTGLPGAVIEITDFDGNVLGTGVVKEDGTFEICSVEDLDSNDSIFVSQNDGTSSSEKVEIKLSKKGMLTTTGENTRELLTVGIFTTLLAIILFSSYYRRNH